MFRTHNDIHGALLDNQLIIKYDDNISLLPMSTDEITADSVYYGDSELHPDYKPIFTGSKCLDIYGETRRIYHGTPAETGRANYTVFACKSPFNKQRFSHIAVVWHN